MFEVEDLEFATLPTLCGCGLVWFNKDVLSSEKVIDGYLQKQHNSLMEEREDSRESPLCPYSTAQLIDSQTSYHKVMGLNSIAGNCSVLHNCFIKCSGE